MAHTVVLRDVPADKVDQVAGDYEAAGATVSKTLQSDGRYTITAIFSDSSNLAKVAEVHGAVDHALMTYRAAKRS